MKRAKKCELQLDVVRDDVVRQRIDVSLFKKYLRGYKLQQQYKPSRNMSKVHYIRENVLN